MDELPKGVAENHRMELAVKVPSAGVYSHILRPIMTRLSLAGALHAIDVREPSSANQSGEHQ
jgi:hypothetical protein